MILTLATSTVRADPPAPMMAMDFMGAPNANGSAFVSPFCIVESVSGTCADHLDNENRVNIYCCLEIEILSNLLHLKEQRKSI